MEYPSHLLSEKCREAEFVAYNNNIQYIKRYKDMPLVLKVSRSLTKFFPSHFREIWESFLPLSVHS